MFYPEPGLKKAAAPHMADGGELDPGDGGLCILDTVTTNRRRSSLVFLHEASR